MHKQKFSVIIPTLQRSPDLWPVVDQLASHPLVLEVLVINNAREELSWSSPKVRVLQQEENIFVNPAWNLGAREAVGEWLAILNDDIRFEDEALEEAARVLRSGRFGMAMPEPAMVMESSRGQLRPFRGRVGHRPKLRIEGPMGTFMCLRRVDYVMIPADMPIWGGDDWLFWHQRRPNAVLVRTRFVTKLGTTSGSPEILALSRRNKEATMRRLGERLHPEGVGPGDVPKYWWHSIARIIEKSHVDEGLIWRFVTKVRWIIVWRRWGR